MEIWKDIKGYEGMYQVSDSGRVRSLDRTDCEGNKRKGKMLKQQNGTGHLSVGLSLNGKKKSKYIHQLVAVAFLNHTPCGYKLVVDHIDNNPLNNKLSNLQLITHRENVSKDTTSISGYTGVTKNKNDKFDARIIIDGKNYALGCFDSAEKASEAYSNSLVDYQNGEFNHKKYNPFKPSSKYKYVLWNKSRLKWMSQVYINNSYVYLGLFTNEFDAHLVCVKAKDNQHLFKGNVKEFRELLKRL